MSKQEHDAAVAQYRSTISTFDKPWYQSSLDLLKKHGFKGLKCLDLCSGNCEFSEMMRDQLQMDVTCAEYIPLQLERAEKLGFAVLPVNLDDDSGKVDNVAAGFSGRFDLVVNLAAIEHVFNADNLLRFVHTVLKPDGYLLVNTPNISFLGYRLYSLLSGNRPFGDGHHVRFWDFRFLRTNLFLNGFAVSDDYRRFYTPPTDVLTRALRNRKFIARLIVRLFYACWILQKLPLVGKDWFTDELTVLCQKEDVPPIGFELPTVRRILGQLKEEGGESNAVARLKEVRKRGWLDEHLYLAALVDGL